MGESPILEGERPLEIMEGTASGILPEARPPTMSCTSQSRPALLAERPTLAPKNWERTQVTNTSLYIIVISATTQTLRNLNGGH